MKYYFLTFEKAYKEFLKYEVNKQKPTSLLAFDRKFKKNVLPYFGKMKIRNISAKIYINWQIEINKKKYSYNYKKNIHYCMCAFYEYLKIYYPIKNNVPKIVGNFKEDFIYKEKEREIWNAEEFKKFISNVDQPIYHALFNFLFLTGCRKGEALAINFNDIKENYIVINKSISKEQFEGKRLILTPKTKKSIRNIQIDKELLSEISSLRKYYNTNFKNFNNNFYIFGGNKPIPTSTLEKYKNFYCDKAKVKRIRIHDFRHSNASLLYNNGIPVFTISKRLGHSSIKTTLDTYIHQEEDNEKRAVEMLSSLTENL